VRWEERGGEERGVCEQWYELTGTSLGGGSYARGWGNSEQCTITSWQEGTPPCHGGFPFHPPPPPPMANYAHWCCKGS
jgi:hypothetical protein